jgi:hypothetical protein
MDTPLSGTRRHLKGHDCAQFDVGGDEGARDVVEAELRVSADEDAAALPQKE